CSVYFVSRGEPRPHLPHPLGAKVSPRAKPACCPSPHRTASAIKSGRAAYSVPSKRANCRCSTGSSTGPPPPPPPPVPPPGPPPSPPPPPPPPPAPPPPPPPPPPPAPTPPPPPAPAPHPPPPPPPPPPPAPPTPAPAPAATAASTAIVEAYLVSERVQLVGDRRAAEDRSKKVLVDPEFLMVGERRREHLAGGSMQESDKIRWSEWKGQRAALAERPGE